MRPHLTSELKRQVWLLPLLEPTIGAIRVPFLEECIACDTCKSTKFVRSIEHPALDPCDALGSNLSVRQSVDTNQFD